MCGGDGVCPWAGDLTSLSLGAPIKGEGQYLPQSWWRGPNGKMGVGRPARTRTGLVVMAEARRAATVPPALPPPREGGAALNLSSEGRALGACGRVGARVDTAARMWPSLPSPGGACRPPVSCEQGREESELGRPGDGWELLVGGPPLQQEQGKCPRRVAGALWPRVCGTGAVGELSPAPPLAQDPQAGSKASEPRGTHWLPGPSAVQCPRQGTGHPRVPSWATSRASVTTPESFSSLPRGDGVVSYPPQPGPARRP